jgi:hypothetical protein
MWRQRFRCARRVVTGFVVEEQIERQRGRASVLAANDFRDVDELQRSVLYAGRLWDGVSLWRYGLLFQARLPDAPHSTPLRRRARESSVSGY